MLDIEGEGVIGVDVRWPELCCKDINKLRNYTTNSKVRIVCF